MNTVFEIDYARARKDFLRAATEAGARLETHTHPLQGLAGEELATDTAWIGPQDAPQVLLSLSATHGVEGIYGSACQRTHLRQVARQGLAPHQALLVVHAVNPHGFSWARRVDHQNIDLNRNQVDFSQTLPANPGYAEFHRMLDRLALTADGLAAFEREVQAFLAAKGRAAVVAISGGQYTHSDGLFFGGLAPSWSQGVMREIAARWLQRAKVITLLDHHTGLGPRAHTEIICRHRVGSQSLALARQWFGADVTSSDAGESQSAVLDGSLRDAFDHWCPQALVVAVGLEVGTLPELQVLRALVADHHLHQRKDPRSDLGQQVRQSMRQAFYGDDEAWRTSALNRSMELHEAALSGMTQHSLD